MLIHRIDNIQNVLLKAFPFIPILKCHLYLSPEKHFFFVIFVLRIIMQCILYFKKNS